MSPRADDLLRPVTPGYDGPLPEGTRGLYAGTGGYVGYKIRGEWRSRTVEAGWLLRGPVREVAGSTARLFCLLSPAARLAQVGVSGPKVVAATDGALFELESGAMLVPAR